MPLINAFDSNNFCFRADFAPRRTIRIASNANRSIFDRSHLKLSHPRFKMNHENIPTSFQDQITFLFSFYLSLLPNTAKCFEFFIEKHEGISTLYRTIKEKLKKKINKRQKRIWFPVAAVIRNMNWILFLFFFNFLSKDFTIKNSFHIYIYIIKIDRFNQLNFLHIYFKIQRELFGKFDKNVIRFQKKLLEYISRVTVSIRVFNFIRKSSRTYLWASSWF